MRMDGRHRQPNRVGEGGRNENNGRTVSMQLPISARTAGPIPFFMLQVCQPPAVLRAISEVLETELNMQLQPWLPWSHRKHSE